MKRHNFSAGPCVLPEEVINKSAQALIDYDNGLSLIEISHRSKAFVDIMENSRNLVLELLGLEGMGYKVLFLQGGASTQFLAVALNLLEKKAAYLNTGTWSDKAIKEARIFDDITEVASSKMQITTTFQRDMTFQMIMIIFIVLQIIQFLVPKLKNFLIVKSLWYAT